MFNWFFFFLFAGMPAKPKIGYGQPINFKFLHPDGKRHFVVHNVSELNMLMMANRKYAGTIAHAVGAKARKLIVERCAISAKISS